MTYTSLTMLYNSIVIVVFNHAILNYISTSLRCCSRCFSVSMSATFCDKRRMCHYNRALDADNIVTMLALYETCTSLTALEMLCSYP